MKVLMCRCAMCRATRAWWSKSHKRQSYINRQAIKGARRKAKMAIAAEDYDNIPEKVSFDFWA